jgi:hypothetical protein
MAQHIGMDREWQLSGLANPVGQRKSPPRRTTCELVHSRVVRIELTFTKQDSENLEMATALTRNLEIPIAICIAGIVYLALLYSVILYLG